MKSTSRKRGLVRDEIAYSDLPEREEKTSKTVGDRQPSDLAQAEIDDNPIVKCQSFKPVIDEFLKNGPSADMETIKNFAAEVSSLKSQVDSTHLSMELDAKMGRGGSQPFRSTDFGFSINSFSSLLDFGGFSGLGGDDSKSFSGGAGGGQTQMFNKSIQDLMPLDFRDNKYHKEYKCYESNDKKRISSKDWMIDYSMKSQTFAPTNEASTQLTNNVVTHVQLIDPNSHREDFTRNPARPGGLSNDKRQMSVEISTASIGIDTEGRLGSYELVKTQFNMQPTAVDQLLAASQQPNFAGLGPPSEESLRKFKQQKLQEQHNLQYQQQVQPIPLHEATSIRPMYHRHQQNHQHMMIPSNQQQQQANSLLPFDNNNIPNYGPSSNAGVKPHHSYLENIFPHERLPQQHINRNSGNSTADADVGLVVPSHSHHIKLESSTGVIDPSHIKDGDVLLERGGKGNHHKGSRYYRRLINERRKSYQGLPDSARAEKMEISLSVVMSVKKSGARFIHKKKGQYIVMSDREARNKISQALREKKERVMLDTSQQ